MDYYGLLFLYYLKGLSGKSVLRLFFNIEAGGTEQLLPENASTPTTTPILADIQYPDGLRTDQYFTYRKTPTTISNKARIKTIKGNTLVWNQLVQNGNFESTSGWSPNIQENTINASSNELTININTLMNNVGVYSTRLLHNRIANHKYLFKLNVYVPHATTIRFGAENEIQRNIIAGWNTVYGIVQSSISSKVIVCYISATEALSFASGETYKIKNYQCFDLTQMGLDSITDLSDFTSLFPLSYYSYNQGSLLSFNGEQIKTVGKNLLNYLNNRTASDITFTYDQSSGAYKVEGTLSLSDAWSDVGINGTVVQNYPRLRKGTYKVSGFNSTILGRIQAWYDDGTNEVIIATIDSTMLFTLNQDAYVYIRGHVTGQGTSFNETIYPMITFADADQTFEPYTSSTLSLPITTYFPNGMKSAGSVYDELTESKAITRIGAVDLGSLTWAYQSGGQGRFEATGIKTIVKKPSASSIVANLKCAKYESASVDSIYTGTVAIGIHTSGDIWVHDASYSDVTTFTQAMSNVYLYYELASSTETPITTEDANEALSLLMGKSVSSDNAKQMIDIITKGE